MARRLGFSALLIGLCLSLMGSAYPLAQEVEPQESRWWVWVLIALVLLAFAAYVIWWWLNPKEETKAAVAVPYRAGGVALPGVEPPKAEAPAVALPTVEVPHVELPKVDLPDVGLPKAEMPAVDLPEVDLSDADLPEVEPPVVDLPEVELTAVELPEVELPAAELPDVELPDVDLPEVALPDVGLPEVRLPEVNLPDVDLPGIEAPDLRATASMVPGAVDDLKLIEGIGPRIASILNAAGIVNFRQLADLSPARILEILGNADPRLLRLADPTSWPQQARFAADGAWDEFQKLTDQLKGGRRA